MHKKWDVIVIGAGGSQAQAMLEASARAGALTRWLAIDRTWHPDAEARARDLGMEILEGDALADPTALRDLLRQAKIVANLAGPYYRTGTSVLDAAIDVGTDYLDICDDADVTLVMLQRHARAAEAGVRALIGMGSSPGTTNVLIRAAVDHLGPVDSVDIHWSVDVADMTDTAARHFWHCFNLVEPDGSVRPVPAFDQLEKKVADFPGTVGPQEVVKLAHPEPLTVPLHLPVRRSANYGTITPLDALVSSWAMAYAADPQRDHGDTGQLADITQAAVDVFRHYRETRPASPRLGSGLIIDVHTDGDGIRFSSGAETEMAEATGVPAAAGLQVMLADKVPTVGVCPPETLIPADFFSALGTVSRGGGGLKVYRLSGGEQRERIRMRDLLAAPVTTGAPA